MGTKTPDTVEVKDAKIEWLSEHFKELTESQRLAFIKERAAEMGCVVIEREDYSEVPCRYRIHHEEFFTCDDEDYCSLERCKKCVERDTARKEG